jgi:hypothetical protein
MTAPMRPEVVRAWRNKTPIWVVLYSTIKRPDRIKLHAVDTQDQAERWRDWFENRQARMLRRRAGL